MRTRALAAGFLLLVAARAARGDLLPNELPGDPPLTVAVRAAVGSRYRPGQPVLLRMSIHNMGGPFDADVRVRETRAGGEAVFRGPRRVRLSGGANIHEILAVPAGGTAGTVLEVLRLPGAGREGGAEPVFRGDLSKVLRPLGENERLLVAAGVEAFPLPEGFVHAVAEPRDLPATAAAFAAADVVVLERVRRDEVSSRQAEALVSWLRSGGSVVFASFRAMAPFERELFGEEGAPRTLEDWRQVVPDSRRFRIGSGPWQVSFRLGRGSACAYAVEPGDAEAWARVGAGPHQLDVRPAGAGLRGAQSSRPVFAASRSRNPWVDALAFEALAPDRPFESAADRAETVALVGALAACVAVALLTTKRRLVAAVILGGIAVAWALLAAVAFDRPSSAVCVTRVRAFTDDGRAEIVTDTAIFVSFGKDASAGLESAAGPVLPVVHREGEILHARYALAREGGRWRISDVRVRRGTPAAVRSRVARKVDEHSDSLRTQALARGNRVRVEELSGGRRRLEFRGEGPGCHIRYLLEMFAPPGEELGWLWIEGEPGGVHVLPEGGVDAAAGSGTLVVAAAPAK